MIVHAHEGVVDLPETNLDTFYRSGSRNKHKLASLENTKRSTIIEVSNTTHIDMTASPRGTHR